MIALRTAALALGAACILAADGAHAQNAAALAKMAARNADAFDTLVTPGARRALDRLTENDDAPAERKPEPSRATAPRVSGTKTTSADTRAPAQQPAPATSETTTAAAPEPQTDSAAAIREIFAQRTDDLLELRIVATGQAVPALSEPFRAGEHSRLFITFDRATLALAAPPALAEAGTTFAGVDIAERAGGVRIALDVVDLRAYELAMAGDTAVLRVALPAEAVAVAAGAAPSVAKPDELALVREAARTGWAAFRRDVRAVASGLGGFLAKAGNTIVGVAGAGWETTSGAAVASARWLAGSVPFASIARALVLLTLLGAPPLVVLRLLRRRQSARAARPAEIVGLEKHTRTAPAAQHVVKQQNVEAMPTPLIAKNERSEKPVKPAKTEKKDRKSRKPAVTRTTAEARLWAARTLAENGADVAEIARQTGLSREAAILLVRRTQLT